MPRGVRKTVNYQSELEEIHTKVSKYKQYIENLEARKKELLQLQRQADADRLMDFLERNALTVDAAMTALVSTESASA